MAKRLTMADLDVAIAWLESNEGEGGEAVSCIEVADFLRRKRDAMETNRVVRSVARKVGCTQAYARRYLVKSGVI